MSASPFSNVLNDNSEWCHDEAELPNTMLPGGGFAAHSTAQEKLSFTQISSVLSFLLQPQSSLCDSRVPQVTIDTSSVLAASVPQGLPEGMMVE